MARILIVDDSPTETFRFREILTKHGYEVIEATNGADGVTMAQAELPDLVLMDMGLPVLDGWQATTQAKEDPELKDIPIIALTAHALETDRKKALAAGADDFDTKPVDIKRLLEKIGKFI